MVSLVDWWLGRRAGTGLRPVELVSYVGAQVAGGIGGAVLANAMYDLAPVSWSATDRSAGHLWLGEVVATAGLILLVFALARSGRAGVAPAAVGAYIGLEHKGLIQRQGNPEDGRRVTVSPTEHGRGNYTLVRHQWATAVAAAAGHDTTHLDAALTLLTAVKDGLIKTRPRTPSRHPPA